MTFRTSSARRGRTLVASGLVAALAVGVIAGPALAGKPGGGSSTSGLAVKMVIDANGNGAPNWGDRITFTFSTGNAYPVISLTCSQNASVVYGDSRPMYWPNAWDDPGIFTLESAAWSGGAASCTALLKGTSKGRIVTLGSLAFAAGA
jgi:hypothetical protein